MEIEQEISESSKLEYDEKENAARRLKELVSSGDRKSVRELMNTTCKCDLFRETGYWPKVAAIDLFNI